MKSRLNIQTFTQALFSLAVVAGLLTFGWHSNARLGEDRQHLAQDRFRELQPTGWFSYGDRLRQQSEEIASMPAYHEMRQALKHLDVARRALLTHAASGHSESASNATLDYQQAIKAVQSHTHDLRTRLTTEEYELFWAVFYAELNDDDDDERDSPLIESRLGLLAISR